MCQQQRTYIKVTSILSGKILLEAMDAHVASRYGILADATSQKQLIAQYPVPVTATTRSYDRTFSTDMFRASVSMKTYH